MVELRVVGALGGEEEVGVLRGAVELVVVVVVPWVVPLAEAAVEPTFFFSDLRFLVFGMVRKNGDQMVSSVIGTSTHQSQFFFPHKLCVL